MRKLFYSTVILTGFFLIFWILSDKSHQIPEIISENDSAYETASPKNSEIVNILSDLNDKNSKIDSFFCENFAIKIKNGNLSFRANGKLAYKNPKYFRLFVNHKITGKEMDIGSNMQIFWFWSKRIEPPYLYYSKHENLKYANLKTPLHPDWMIESLNLGVIDANKIQTTKINGDLIYLYENRKSVLDEPLKLVTIINTKTKLITSRTLLNSSESPIVTTTYGNKIINFIWHDENVTMQWDISQGMTNMPIAENYWILPEMKNKVDIGE